MRPMNLWVGVACAAVLAVAGGLALEGATDDAGAQPGVSVSAAQLLTNQRISQAAVRRANRALNYLAPVRTPATDAADTGRDGAKPLSSIPGAGGGWTSAQIAAGAGPAGPPGPPGPPGPAATALWAVIDNSGACSLIRGSGALSVETVGVSRCDVKFDRDVSACVVAATVAETASADIASVTYSEHPNPDPSGLTRDEVYVATTDGAEPLAERHDFYIVLFC